MKTLRNFLGYLAISVLTGALAVSTAKALDVTVPLGGSIQTAIDQVNAAGGGSVILDAGIYTNSVPLNIKSFVTLTGQGPSNTIITNSSPTNVIQQASEGLSNVAVENLTVTGRHTNACYGILIQALTTYHTNIIITNVEVAYCGMGVHLKRVCGVNVVNCNFHDNGTTFASDLGYFHNLYIRQCDNTNYSIMVTNCQLNSSLSGNGLNLSYNVNIFVENSTAMNNYFRGIRAADSVGFTVWNCTLSGNGNAGLIANTEINPTKNISWSGNTAENNLNGGFVTAAGVTGTAFNNDACGNSPTNYSFNSSIIQSGNTTCSRLPAAPTGMAASAGNAQVALIWNASSGANSYNVKSSTVNGGPYTVIASNLMSLVYTNSNLVNGTTYYYVVSALNAGGESANSAQASATPQVAAPSAPTGLAATAGDTQVGLTWSASSGATSYNVKRATVKGGPYATITNVATTGFADTAVVNGTTYYYVVSALNAGGESADSTQVSATPQVSAPTVPTGLAGTPGNTQAILSWSASSGATSYNVKRSLTSGSGYATVTNVTGTSVVDSGLNNGTTYYYVVSALSAGGESDNSAEASVTPSDLFGWWKFDETSGTTAADSGGSGNNGTLLSGATWGSGISSNAVDLNGTANSYVSFPSGLVSTLNDFSVATWVKVDTNATWARIFDFGSGTGTYMFLAPASGGNTVRYAITTGTSGGEQQINSPTVLSTGVWHHVAVTLSGSVGILYVDGTAVGTNSSMTLNPSSLGSTTQNYIGKSQWNDPYLNGSVDDFRLYSRALSVAEVAALADAALSSPWNTLDIGAVGAIGAADYVNGTYTIQGSGTNIAGVVDAFRYVYQPSSGDCSNTVRVVTVPNTSSNAKAGVMIRESLAANAREAGIWVTPSSGIIFTYRSSTGGSTTVSTSTGKAAPYWVRIARVGSSFRAYYSANGTTWTQLGSKTISMATSACIGMGVESGTNTLNTATMDNVTTVP